MPGTSRNRSEDPRLESIRKGNREAFNDLFRDQYENLCRFALGYVDRLQIAEDIVQDVFFDLWENRNSLEIERTIKAYTYGMTRHRALKHLRRTQIRDEWSATGDLRKITASSSPAQVGDLIVQKEHRKQAEKAIDALSERQRQIFLLSRYHDLTYSEIAVALDISSKTVETHMSRALKVLHSRLEVVMPSRKSSLIRCS